MDSPIFTPSTFEPRFEIDNPGGGFVTDLRERKEQITEHDQIPDDRTEPGDIETYVDF
ncbi:hypothetical protein K7432_000587 [Basidiobolus ranarum]|uniref:Uncharacterized protein n=1 Tax=Basidiobolus ranarum TaxID=34480 RepID=A0ABR2WB12_9FUNG